MQLLPEFEIIKKIDQIVNTKKKPSLAVNNRYGFVYFIIAKGTDRVKIGYTCNLDNRIKSMDTDCPVELIPILCFKFGYKGCLSHGYEKKLHSLFKRDRVKGEWFYLSDDILDFIDKTTQNGEEWAEIFINENVDKIAVSEENSCISKS